MTLFTKASPSQSIGNSTLLVTESMHDSSNNPSPPTHAFVSLFFSCHWRSVDSEIVVACSTYRTSFMTAEQNLSRSPTTSSLLSTGEISIINPSWAPVNYGVPQGCVPSVPLSLPSTCSRSARLYGLNFHCYTDDTQLYPSTSSSSQLPPTFSGQLSSGH